MFSRSFSSAWSRFFGRAAQARRAAQASSNPPPSPRTLPIRTRQELEVAWLLRFLPFEMQQALWSDVLALLRRCQPVEKLSAEQYTWPGVPGVTLPRYSSGVLPMKTLDGLYSRLEDDLKLSVGVLCAPESLLSRPMRNTLLAMEGARLGQLWEALSRHLKPSQALAAFRQALGARGC